MAKKRHPHKSLSEHLAEFSPQDRFWLVVLGQATNMLTPGEAMQLIDCSSSDLTEMNQRYAFAIQALSDRLKASGTTVVDDLARAVRR